MPKYQMNITATQTVRYKAKIQIEAESYAEAVLLAEEADEADFASETYGFPMRRNDDADVKFEVEHPAKMVLDGHIHEFNNGCLVHGCQPWRD